MAGARAHPERLALNAPEGLFTYADLLRASAATARRLLEGRPDLAGARVAYLLSPGFRWTALLWGTWRAGGVGVPLALAHPTRELAYALDDAEPHVVVAQPELAERVRAPAEERRIPLLTTDDVVPASPERLEEEGDPTPPGHPDRPALILYTSGTTGSPKGVVLTHGNLDAQVRSLVGAWGWSQDDHALLVLPLHHVHGIVNVLACALHAGACCSVLPRFDAEETWERMARGDLTVFMAVPTLYARLIDAWNAADEATRLRWGAGARALRLMVSGSAALPVGVLRRWEEITGHRLLERYGMTEIGMALSNPLVGERRPGRVGAPLPGVDVRLVEGERPGTAAGGDGPRERSDRPVPPGAPGELQVRGATVFRGYWRRPEATARAFTEDGYFRTGDLAVCEDGSYRILGRASIDIIKTGGEKVSALEVEEVLREHVAVADCAVVGVADPEWGERVCAAVVVAPGADDLTLEGMRAWARERLAPWKVPGALRLVDRLPRNAMGKVDKPEVRGLFEAGASAPPLPRPDRRERGA